MEFRSVMMPLVGALIGWVTNYLAIRLLFRPYRRVYLPFTKIYLQGVLPKRQQEIAAHIGEIVENELLNVQDLFSQVVQPESLNELISIIVTAVQSRLECYVPRYMPEGIRQKINELVGSFVDKELRNVFGEVQENFINHLKQNVTIAELVEKRINSLDVRQAEDLVIRVAKTELKHIEVMGGVLGFLIGLIQALLLGLEGVFF